MSDLLTFFVFLILFVVGGLLAWVLNRPPNVIKRPLIKSTRFWAGVGLLLLAGVLSVAQDIFLQSGGRIPESIGFRVSLTFASLMGYLLTQVALQDIYSEG